MKIVEGIYESDTAYNTPVWVSYEWGGNKGELRVIGDFLCFAYLVSRDSFYKKNRIVWKHVSQDMIFAEWKFLK